MVERISDTEGAAPKGLAVEPCGSQGVLDAFLDLLENEHRLASRLLRVIDEPPQPCRVVGLRINIDAERKVEVLRKVVHESWKPRTNAST